MRETRRISLVIDSDVLDYVDSERSKIGVSRAAMFAFMVEQYRNQKDALKAMGDMNELITKLDELGEKVENSKA